MKKTIAMLLTLAMLMSMLALPGGAALAQRLPDTMLREHPAQPAVPAPTGARPANVAGLVYLTSLDIPGATFAVYDVDAGDWTSLAPFETGCQMAVGHDNSLYGYNSVAGEIDLYDPATDTWSQVMPAPPGASGQFCNLEITAGGEFLYTEAWASTLWYTADGVWNTVGLPFQTNVMGDYDPTTGQYVVGELNTTNAHLIDVATWAITDFASPLYNGEWARFGSVMGNRYFFEADASNIHSFDLSDPALPPLDSGVSGPWYGGSAADRANFKIYVADFYGESFWVFEPAANVLTPLAGGPSTTHTSVAFVGAAGAPGPNIVAFPQVLGSQQCQHAVVTQTLTVCNTGDADLTWALSEQMPEGRLAGSMPVAALGAAADYSGGGTAWQSRGVLGATQPDVAFRPEGQVAQDDPIPWLSEDPTGGTALPGECAGVTVTYDSAGLMPSSYLGLLAIASNDPQEPQVNVPVNLTVLECYSNELHLNRTKIATRPTAPPSVRVIGQVRVLDQTGLGVLGAEVMGEWTLPDGTIVGPYPALNLTDIRGRAKFRIKDTQTGLYTLCITDIVAAGYETWPAGGYPGDANPCMVIMIQP